MMAPGQSSSGRSIPLTPAESRSTRIEPTVPITEHVQSADDLGGDPVCWLDKVCPTCGLFTGSDESTCPRCGDAMPT